MYVMKYNKNEMAFIKHVKTVCKIYGVKCSLRKSTYVKMDGNVRCSGWFDESAPELVVAIN